MPRLPATSALKPDRRINTVMGRDVVSQGQAARWRRHRTFRRGLYHRRLADCAVRLDRYADTSGPVSDQARENGFRSAVGTPVIVEGRMWGVAKSITTSGMYRPGSAVA